MAEDIGYHLPKPFEADNRYCAECGFLQTYSIHITETIEELRNKIATDARAQNWDEVLKHEEKLNYLLERKVDYDDDEHN